MFSQRFTIRLFAAFAGSFAFLAPMDLGLSTACGAPTTPMDDLVAYGMGQNTDELFRYEFKTDSYRVIGPVVDQNGVKLNDVKAMAFIPSGPNKGVYATSEENPSVGYLAKIDLVTAVATVKAQKIAPASTVKVFGMVACRLSGVWQLLATDNKKDLYKIDPATGVGTLLCALSNKYDSIAMDRDGILTGIGRIYGFVEKQMYVIDYPARILGGPSKENKVGSVVPFHRVEGLDFAFGDTDAKITIPSAPGPWTVVPQTWTNSGALFGLSENDSLLVVNPATGQAVQYPCSFTIRDYEGLVLMTRTQDIWGQITVDAHD